jgi:hypothetical protein
MQFFAPRSMSWGSPFSKSCGEVGDWRGTESGPRRGRMRDLKVTKQPRVIRRMIIKTRFFFMFIVNPLSNPKINGLGLMKVLALDDEVSSGPYLASQVYGS